MDTELAMAESGGMPNWLPALLQLASPALPIGSFSYSQGLEAAAWSGWVRDEASALAWIDSHWRQSFAVRELPVVLRVAQVLAEPTVVTAGDTLERLMDLDRQFMASRDSQEARAETRQVGAALLRWLGTLHPDGRQYRWAQAIHHRHKSLCAPTAFALCADSQGLPPVASRFAWGFSWLENQVQAAVKIVPLGQSAGQRLLMNLRERLADPSDPDDWSFSPLASVMAMRHERQYTRLFRS